MKNTKKILILVISLFLPCIIASCVTDTKKIDINDIKKIDTNQIKTISTIEKINDYPMYTMTYTGDYYFDDFLKVGASRDKDVFDYVSNKLLKGVPLDFELPVLGCSTLFSKTPEGDYLFGRNFDLYYSPPMIVHTKPDNGYQSVSIVNLSFIGYNQDYLPDNFVSSIYSLAAPYFPIDGMNEKGLSVGMLVAGNLTTQDTGKIDIQTTTAIRMLLDNCATVEESIAMLSEYDMQSSANAAYHYQITDATGDSAIVEYIDNEMSVLNPDEFYQACTNFILTPGKYFNYGGGLDRYEILMAKLDETKGILTEKETMDLMEAVSMEAVSVGCFATQWSVVYNLSDLTYTISVGGDYDNLIEVDINPFL